MLVPFKLLYRFFGTLLLVSSVGGLLGCDAAALTLLPVPTATAFAVCEPSPVGMSKISFPEIQGTMSSEGEIWALLFFERAVVNQELKIVWRVTGEGEPLAVEASHPDGTVISPIWGPEMHGDSNWARPGFEWGSGFNFPKPGCWTLTLSSGKTAGEIRLVVAP